VAASPAVAVAASRITPHEMRVEWEMEMKEWCGGGRARHSQMRWAERLGVEISKSSCIARFRRAATGVVIEEVGGMVKDKLVGRRGYAFAKCEAGKGAADVAAASRAAAVVARRMPQLCGCCCRCRCACVRSLANP